MKWRNNTSKERDCSQCCFSKCVTHSSSFPTCRIYGASIDEICSHNGAVAEKLKRFDVAKLWHAIAIIMNAAAFDSAFENDATAFRYNKT
jgi:hypothetical protein